MGTPIAPDKRKPAKTVLAIIITLTVILTILYWATIKFFQLQGLTLYFAQLALYLTFFLLACWGMKREQISLPVTRRRVVEALAVSLVSWLVFLLVIQLLGLAHVPQQFLALQKIPAWKIGLQILSTWLFVGLGEEVLFRGYFLKAFWRHFTGEADRRRMLKAGLLASAAFSLWHLPIRIVEVISGELNWLVLLVSLVILFLMGLGFTWLYIRSDNILLTGLVHGLMDYPLVGKDTQLSFVILLAAIAWVEIARRAARKKLETGDQQKNRKVMR